MYNYSVDQWILLFFLYSFAGYLWEVAYVSLRSRRPVNRGFLFGPVLPIYGFGAITILHAVLPVQGNILLTALLGGLSASILEYFTGWLMEKLFGMRYWDYSNDPGNIRGYVCPRATFAWCLFSILLVRWIHPYFNDMLLRVPQMADSLLAHGLAAGLAVDTTVSARQALDLKALLQEMAEENEKLAAAVERAERVRDRVDAKLAYLDVDKDGIPDLEELQGRLRTARGRAREAVLRVRERRASRFAAARRILRNNPSARAERFQTFIERIREEADRSDEKKSI